ncbi:pilus assembly protein TadG-related protein [Halomonas mongoliensis]|uniref:pilus assembly protein TadG-related protein n=1 Tax=Halomonas mongoliensis TaxID=321265 RepID=UPI00403AFAEE
MRLPRLNYPLPPRQRGVFGLMAVGLMLLMVISVALAIDTGRLYLEQRHMQRVADLAALEAAGAVTLVSQTPDTELASAAQEAARRNGHDSEDSKRALGAVGGGVCHAPEGDGSVRVFFAHSPDAASVDCNTLEGSYTGTLERHAVEVTASHQVRPSLFGSLLGEDEITISATAAAYRPQAEPYAVFSVGSRLLNVDTDESALAPVLRGLLDLGADASVAGFGGIADASVSLADLVSVDELTAGSTEELLGAELKLLDLITRLKAAHHDSGSEEDAPELLALQALNDRLTAFISTENIITVGDLLDIGTERAPLDVEVSALDLLSTGLLIANQENAVSLPGLILSVPGVTNIEAILEVIEPPKIAIGPVGCLEGEPDPSCGGQWKTEARTAQVQIELNADVKVPLLADLQLGATVIAGGARAGIESVDIPKEGPEEGKHEWDVKVAAYGLPISLNTTVGAGLLSDKTYLPWLEDANLGMRGDLDNFLTELFSDVPGGDLVTNLLSGLVGIVTGLVGGLLDLVGGILGGLLDGYCYRDVYVHPEPSYVDETNYPTSGVVPGSQIWERYRYGSVVLGIPVCTSGYRHRYHSPSPSFKGIEEESGSVEHSDTAWGKGGAMTVKEGSSATLEWPNKKTAKFYSSLEDTVSLSAGDFSIDVANRQGVDISGLLSSVLAVLESVIDQVILRVAGPLLDVLGVGLGEAKVEVHHISDATGPPELL